MPSKEQFQDAPCTLCKAHTFVQFLNTKMVGKTANICIEGVPEKMPHMTQTDELLVSSFHLPCIMLVNQRENLIFDHDLLQRA